MIKYGKHNPFLDELINRTSFIDSFFTERNRPVPFLARLYCLENNIHEHPRCENPNCPTHAKVDWNIGKKEFAHHCCPTCSATDPKVKEKVINTNIRIRGVSYPQQCQKVKDKYKKTCRMKWGVDNVSQSDEIKAKIKQTNILHFGVEWVM